MPLNRPFYPLLLSRLSSLIYSGSRDSVQHVWVDGQLKFKNKQLINVDDAESVIEKVKLWQNKIQ